MIITERMLDLAGVSIDAKGIKIFEGKAEIELRQNLNKDLTKKSSFVTHYGFNVIDSVYKRGINTIRRAINKLGGDADQAVYLGYNSQKDRFLMGFDIWDDDGLSSALVEFELRLGKVVSPKVITHNHNSFYESIYNGPYVSNNKVVDIVLD